MPLLLHRRCRISWIDIRIINRVVASPLLCFFPVRSPPPPRTLPKCTLFWCPSWHVRSSGGVAWRVALGLACFSQYDGRIVKVALHAMPVMLLCHCLFALFAFSGGTFFESEYVADALSSRVDVRGERSKGKREKGACGTKRRIETESVSVAGEE